MKVLLKQTVQKLGQAGQVVEVKPAYARNFLIPKGLADIATPDLIEKAEKLSEQLKKQEQTQKQNTSALAKKLQDMTVKISAPGNSEGKLYAAIHAKDIQAVLSEKYALRLPPGFSISPDSVKEAGKHALHWSLGDGQSGQLELNLESQTQ